MIKPRPKNWKKWIPESADILRDMLMLVGYEVPVEVIAKWSDEQKADSYKWAYKWYLRASDNIVQMPPRPDCINGYEEKRAPFAGHKESLEHEI